MEAFMPLLIPPAAARAFRAVAGKCRTTRARDPALQVLARIRTGTLTLFASFGEVCLALTVLDQIGSGSALIPLDALDRPDGQDLADGVKHDPPKPPDVPDRWWRCRRSSWRRYTKPAGPPPASRS